MGMKRRKTEIEDLRDETLIEILARVPVKSSHQCKLVSKRWLGLISSPCFVRCHRRRHQVNHHLQLVNYRTMIINPSNPFTMTFEVQALPKSHPIISLDFLNQQWPMNMLSCVSNDLLLLTVPNCGGYTPSAPSLNLSVSNPLSKQSYRLPEPPPSFLDDPFTEFNGIICSVDDPTQYKVVLVKNTPSLITRGGSTVRSSEILNFYVFSSNNSSWCNFPVPASPNFVSVRMVEEAIGQYTTTLDGALYWCTNMIMVYNPFDKDNPQQCDFIHLPQEAKLDKMYGKKVSPVDQRSLCIANVEQHLQLYHWSYVTAFTQTLTVWDIKDYTRGHGGTWNIKHFVDLTCINWLCADVRMSIKGFDLYDGDVLYVFSRDHCLLAVNLRSKTLQLVSDFKSTLSSSLPCFRLFSYCPPLWPTPITNCIAATPPPTTALL